MIQSMYGPDYRDVAQQFIAQTFLPTDDSQRRTWIVERMTSTPQHVMASALKETRSRDLAAAASARKVPAMYIEAAGPRPELQRFRELCPQLVVGRTVGSGHFNQLEVPDQVNAMIERFRAISL